MALKVKLEEIFAGQITKCLICGRFGKSKHLGLEFVAPKVMADEVWTGVVICAECLRKEKGAVTMDLAQRAEGLEEEARLKRNCA